MIRFYKAKFVEQLGEGMPLRGELKLLKMSLVACFPDTQVAVVEVYQIAGLYKPKERHQSDVVSLCSFCILPQKQL